MPVNNLASLLPIAALTLGTLVPVAQSTFYSGVSGQGTNPERISSLGGNTLRLYYPQDFTEELKSCEHGLKIVLGLGVEPYMDGATAIKHAAQVVHEHKHIPCVSSWVIVSSSTCV